MLPIILFPRLARRRIDREIARNDVAITVDDVRRPAAKGQCENRRYRQHSFLVYCFSF